MDFSALHAKHDLLTAHYQESEGLSFEQAFEKAGRVVWPEEYWPRYATIPQESERSSLRRFQVRLVCSELSSAGQLNIESIERSFPELFS